MKEKHGIKRLSSVTFISILYSLMLITMSGCSMKGPLFSEASLQHPTSSIIYIYRPDAECLGSREIEFLFDSEHIVTLKGKEYAYVYADPGAHIITSGELKKDEIPSLKIKISTNEGKKRYVQYKITCESDYLIFNSTAKLYMGGVPEHNALPEIRDTTLTTIPNRSISDPNTNLSK